MCVYSQVAADVHISGSEKDEESPEETTPPLPRDKANVSPHNIIPPQKLMSSLLTEIVI